MGSPETEMVMVDGVPFAAGIESSKNTLLSLMGHVKYNAIGIYLEPAAVLRHLAGWKGKTAGELAGDQAFFEALTSAPGEKLFRIVTIKEIKGSQYGDLLEGAVRDGLAEADRYGDDEEAVMEEVATFFQRVKYFKPGSAIILRFMDDSSPSSTAEIMFAPEEKEETAKLTVENGNVAEMMKRWYLGGRRAVSPSTIRSLAETLSAKLEHN